ncbi:NUDIX hydrolase [Segniliparus rotundus DSM 44985]|uniref:8-oxo-dGTP diphosphatase n=1 Tax=Segniliparus rotundus (strain ATCC BAA-972 / CDC 1076 / CIP 108378 / DSM 44985 / JCM 13578) TaxID=640132 RepID=D6ZCJ9_SEGRD|nr:NUDIX domain-containing protein [Segniliparus rotundus]ADG97041.1 NUDIX hydrolase [Segniliparus rotundus DSM 44985]
MDIIRVVAAVIIDAQGRFLVARKRGTAVFMQAGGKVEPDEAPLDALVRELDEELGVQIGPEHAQRLGVFEAPAAHEPAATVLAEVYRVACAQEPHAHAEIEEIAWITPGADDQRAFAPLTELLLDQFRASA